MVVVESTAETSGIKVIRLRNPPVNALGSEACRRLLSAVRQAKEDRSVRAIILAGADGLPFSAGADVKEFVQSSETSRAKNTIGSLDNLISEVEGASVPIVAAIAGVALGGGLELAMGCHYRVAVKSARLGLPEVKLGIIPGSGGTQRLPRLIGLRKAFGMIVSGEPISAAAAHERGLVDAVSAEGDAGRAALEFVQSRLSSGALPVRRTRDLKIPDLQDAETSPTEVVRQAAKAMKLPLSHRGGEAQKACVEVVAASGLMDLDEGLALEKRRFVDLLLSPQSMALRYAFLAERQTTRTHPTGPDAKPVPVRRVGVVGGGTTGSGIVVSFLDTGAHVTLVEANGEGLRRASETVKGIYASKVKRGQLTVDQAKQIESSFRATVSLEDLHDMDLVVEAIFEDMALKKKIFATLDKICPPRAILATNTSSLDVDEIASATSRPAQVLGMHFFSPTHLMRLVELVKGAQTSKSAIATIAAASRAMKKVCVVVGNCNGFVGNRMLFSYRAEMEKLVEEGASPYHVDRVLYAFGFPMGPFAMSDLAGLDIGYKIRKAQGLPPSSMSDKLCELGRLGQKTGSGWYKYDKTKGRTPIPDPEVLAYLEGERRSMGIAVRTDITDQEILERCLYPLVNEGFKILGEGIASSPEDIDVIWLTGYAWPRWKGGPMYWARMEVGLDTLLRSIQSYQGRFSEARHWEPAALLESWVSKGEPVEKLVSRL